MARIRTTVRVYKGERQYRKDAVKMGRRGWRVVSAQQETRRSGLGRVFLLGLFAAVFPPRPRWVVTYQRD